MFTRYKCLQEFSQQVDMFTGRQLIDGLKITDNWQE